MQWLGLVTSKVVESALGHQVDIVKDIAGVVVVFYRLSVANVEQCCPVEYLWSPLKVKTPR